MADEETHMKADDANDLISQLESGMNLKHVQFAHEFVNGQHAGFMTAAYRHVYNKKKGETANRQAYVLKNRPDINALIKALIAQKEEDFTIIDAVLFGMIENPDTKDGDRISAIALHSKIHERIIKKVEVTEVPQSRQDILDKLKRMEEGT